MALFAMPLTLHRDPQPPFPNSIIQNLHQSKQSKTASPKSKSYPPTKNSTSSSRSPQHHPIEEMCILTPYQFTCADPFGEHLCGDGYYFHARAVCHHKPSCTKFYTAPIMLETSCGVCVQGLRYECKSSKTPFERSPLTSFSLDSVSNICTDGDSSALDSDDVTSTSLGSGSEFAASGGVPL